MVRLDSFALDKFASATVIANFLGLLEKQIADAGLQAWVDGHCELLHTC